MGLFDRDDEELGDRNEVRVDVKDGGSSTSTSSGSTETRLEEEVNTKVAGNSSSVKSSSSVTMKDLQKQNEKIIELLEKLTGDQKTGSKSRSRGENDDDGMRGDMGELL